MSKQIVSFSGGKDSTAMLLMMLERGERVDDVVFFDTGWEFPQMYEHIEKVEKETGIEIVRLHPRKPFDYFMSEHVITRGKHAGTCGYGWPRPMARWCTSEKTAAIDKYKRTFGDTADCIGIAFDEQHRCRQGKRYPLCEYEVTESQALEYCKRRGFDWGGLYDHFKRVSCWCCPLQSLKELKELRSAFPDLWKRLLQMDNGAWNTFRINESANDLDERFSQEERQLVLF